MNELIRLLWWAFLLLIIVAGLVIPLIETRLLHKLFSFIKKLKGIVNNND